MADAGACVRPNTDSENLKFLRDPVWLRSYFNNNGSFVTPDENSDAVQFWEYLLTSGIQYTRSYKKVPSSLSTYKNDVVEGYTQFLTWIEKQLSPPTNPGGTGFEWFATFTFKAAPGDERGDKQYRLFMHKLNRTAFGSRYWKRGEGLFSVRASELQKRGVVHYHCLIGGGVDNLRRAHWKEEWLHQDPNNGFARIYKYDPGQGARDYCAKYLSKDAVLDLTVPTNVRKWLMRQAVIDPVGNIILT